MKVKLSIVVIIPESFITNGNNKHPEPTKVFVAAKIVLEVEFLGTKYTLYIVVFLPE